MPLEENKLMELPQTDQARDVPLIKSKERVQKHGEVFTPDWMVRKMLSYPEIQEKLQDMHASFLEISLSVLIKKFSAPQTVKAA